MSSDKAKEEAGKIDDGGPAIEVVDPVSKCCSSDCHAVAAFIVYWPGQTKNMCAKCCGRATMIGTAMGFDLQSRPIPARTIVSARKSGVSQ